VLCRDGWFELLTSTLEHMHTCAQLHKRSPNALLLCPLELSVIASRTLPAERCASASALIKRHLMPSNAAPADMHFHVMWPQTPRRFHAVKGVPAVPEEAAQGLLDVGWLNVINLAVACTHSGRSSGEVLIAVAVRSMLPDCSGSPQPVLPLADVTVTVESDLGVASMPASPVPLWRSTSARVSRSGTSAAGSMADNAPARDAQRLMKSSSVDNNMEMNALAEHQAVWMPAAVEGAVGGAQAAPVAAGRASERMTQLLPGEWAVFAVRLQPGKAEHVSVQALTLLLGRCCTVNFALDSASAVQPGQVQPLICGAPAYPLSTGMVGRDAPFGRMATILEPGSLSLSLTPGALPPVRVVLSEPVGLVHVGEVACITATVTSLGVSPVARSLTILARQRGATAGAATAGGSVPCRIYTGDTFADAVPLQNAGLELPVLAKGVAHTVVIWVLGEGKGEGDLEVGVEGWPEESLQRWHFEVLEPFMFVAKLTTSTAQAVLMLGADGGGGDDEDARKAASLHVPCGCRCVMTLLATSVVPFPIALERLELGDMEASWALHGSSCENLASESQVLFKNDVFAASFELSTPQAAGQVPLGALRLQCRRLDNVGSTVVREKLVARLDGVANLEKVAAGKASRFVLRHELPKVTVCSEIVSARLRMPSHATVGQPFQLVLIVTVAACMPAARLTVRATIGASGAVKLDVQQAQIVVATGDKPCEVTWHAVGQEAGQVAVLGTVEVESGLDEQSGAHTSNASESRVPGVTPQLDGAPIGKGWIRNGEHVLELQGGMLLVKAPEGQ
jgi:hypothetical protein